MSAADNHKKRSSRGYLKQHHTLAPKKTPAISRGHVRHRRKRSLISSLFSSLFFRKTAEK